MKYNSHRHQYHMTALFSLSQLSIKRLILMAPNSMIEHSLSLVFHNDNVFPNGLPNFKLIPFFLNATKHEHKMFISQIKMVVLVSVITKHWSTIDITFCFTSNLLVQHWLAIAQRCNTKCDKFLFSVIFSGWFFFLSFGWCCSLTMLYKMLVFRFIFTTWKHKYFTKCSLFTRKTPLDFGKIGHSEVLYAIKMNERRKKKITHEK